MQQTSTAAPSAASGDSQAESYGNLAGALLDEPLGACLLDGQLKPTGQSGGIAAEPIAAWLREQGWPRDVTGALTTVLEERWVTAMPLHQDRRLLGVFCVTQRGGLSAPAAGHARTLVARLKPCLDSLQRELVHALPRARLQTLTERTAELEWLFKVSHQLKGSTSNRRVTEELLNAAAARIRAGLGVLYIPDKRLCMSSSPGSQGAPLQDAWQHTRDSLLAWVQRNRRPLVINTAGRGVQKFTPCKILAVPVTQESGQVSGLLGFFNPVQAGDFGTRHTFLARHLARQLGSLVEAQFDLMTGLYTRDGLEQMYGHAAERDPNMVECSLVYVDIDHMRVVNESHGFELGNELIVRVAELLVPPLAPSGSFAGRVAGDRFVLVLPGTGDTEALAVASGIQKAAAKLKIGAAGNTIDVSVSCGIAQVVDIPQALARAIAAAEIACKAAKSHGRNRVELYAFDDGSIMRRQGDVIAVGQLRAALKSDGLLLYGQRIVPLRDGSLPGGYEILMRMRTPDGELQSPGPLIDAAKHYQLLPSIDLRVVTRALQTLAPYRSTLRSRGVSFSINISGQSLDDESFIQHLIGQLQEAALPPDSIMLEITEQAAVGNLKRANEVLRKLQQFGCRFALDDYGTGASTLAALKALQVSRIKIDGSFVRDVLTEPRSQAAVRSITELARTLKLETVAEYVENEAIAKAVRGMGVDYAQGYAYGEPRPLEQVLAELAREESARLRRQFLEL